jgi:23S rRNA (uracil1939-C5)-methyltransferase
VAESLLTLAIERPVAGGRMLARHEGRVVLVAGAIPGERVLARLEPGSRKVWFASTVDVLDASPDRRPTPGNPACGGLAYSHVEPARQRALKAEVVADSFRRLGRITLGDPVSVAESPERGFRLRGRVHVKDRRAGFFLERTHRLCDAGATAQFGDETLDAVARLIRQLGGEADRCGAIQIAENVAASERVCHLESVEGRRFDLEAITAGWRAIDGLTGLTAVSAGRFVRCGGNARVTDTAEQLCGAGQLPVGVQWTRTAASFFQGNRFLTGALLTRVLHHARGDRVLDLYAGVGLFSVALAARGSSVTAVEGDDMSVADLEINAAPWARGLTTRQASVEAVLMTVAPAGFDVVVLDPPRTGASPEAIGGILALAASRVVYVSCDPATLARDAALLVAGGYALRSVEAFDLFPNTPHVEMVAVFDR